jgi:hypothetical protein
MPALRQQVFIYLKNNPNATTKELKRQFKNENWNSVRTYRGQFWNLQNRSDISDINKPKSNYKSHSIPPPMEHTLIDDPDELLMSVAIRELNKPDPDPRWANILISCKKENITMRNEMLDQFKQLPTKVLVNLLSKNSPEES